MPRIEHDRFWYGTDEGRQAADFSTDTRPSDGIGTTDHDQRPRHHQAELEGSAGGFPRFVDDRRTRLAVPVAMAGAGLILSGRSTYYAHSFTILAATTIPANALWVLLSNNVPILMGGTITANSTWNGGVNTGVQVNNLALGVFDPALSAVVPPELVNMTVVGSIHVAAME